MNSQRLIQLLVCLGLLSAFAVGGVAAHDAQAVTESVEAQDTATLLSETTTQTADNRSGGDTGAQAADIQIQSISAPGAISVDENLTVDYILENVGDADGTESFVDLLVNGTDSAFDDTDENVAVPAGGTTNGTLVFDNVSGFFSVGDTIDFTVELFDFGDVVSGTTDVVDDSPDIQIRSISAPSTVPTSGNLTVDYTLENVGGTNGTESFVDLRVNGTDSAFDDTDENVAVPAGGTTSGTLVFDNVSGFFGVGDTINFSVELFDFGDVVSGTTDVVGSSPDIQIRSISAPSTVPTSGNLTVDYTLENVGNADGTESFVDLRVNGTDSLFDDTDENVTVPAGGTTSGTLVFDNVRGFFGVGDTINFSVELFDFGDVVSSDTGVYEPAPEHSVGDVNRDDDVDIVDAVLIQQYLAQLNPEPFDSNLADVDRSGDISIVDAVLIQRKLAKIDDPGVTNVTAVDAPDTVAVGGQLNVSATITNDGGLGTVQTAEFQFAANESDLGTNATVSATTVDLGGGETTEPMVTIDTAQLDPGTYHIAVVTGDDSTRVTVNVVST